MIIKKEHYFNEKSDLAFCFTMSSYFGQYYQKFIAFINHQPEQHLQSADYTCITINEGTVSVGRERYISLEQKIYQLALACQQMDQISFNDVLNKLDLCCRQTRLLISQ